MIEFFFKQPSVSLLLIQSYRSLLFKSIFMKHFNFLILFLLGMTVSLFGQSEAIAWGEIPQDDLSLTEYPADPNASAVVLEDYGHMIMELEGSEVLYRFQRHKRIKILDAATFDQSAIDISYHSGTNSPEHLSYLQAQTFLPNGEKFPLKGKDFIDRIEEEVNMASRSFSFPEIQDGAVLEYRYEIVTSRIGALRTWYFQGDTPVRNSELSIEVPNWFRYEYLFRGSGDLLHSEEEEKSIDVRVNTITKIRTKKYRMENIPVMKPEPLMSNIDDHRSKIIFQLKEIRFPNGTTRPYMTTWADLSKKLMMDPQFGLQLSEELNHNTLFNATTNAIINSDKSQEDKAEQLYQYVVNNISWNQQYSIYSSINLNESLRSKKANSGELNMMLCILLRKAGIDASPVLVSTRSNGQMIRFFPVEGQFNHILVHTELAGKNMLMDISDAVSPINLPRKDALSKTGWLVNDQDSRWVDIDVPFSTDTYFANLKLEETGQIWGEVRGDIKGYQTVNHRMACQKVAGGKDFSAQWMSKYPSIKMDSLMLSNVDEPSKPFLLSMNCNIPNAAVKSGDQLSLQPLLFSNILENPFSAMERMYAVDFPYPMKEKHIMKLTIPNGYTVEKLPEEVHLILPNEAAQFHYLIKQKDNVIQLVSRITIRQTTYHPTEYLQIKNFFDQIIAKQKDAIILKKENG